MRFFLYLIFAVFVLVVGPSPVLAEKRIALVIGNSDYKLISSLANPTNDAILMTRALRDVGFEVIERKDADQRTMKRAIIEFGRQLEAAGKDAVGLFYYAGHAVEAQGANQLIPLGAQIEREVDLEIEAVSAQWVLSQMKFAGNGLNMVILDSCRNNPFKGKFRSLNRGLGKMNAPTGSFVAYSAAPGRVAYDGNGTNSVYTAALAAAITKPGIELEDAFKQVRVQVHTQSGGKQTPWEEGSVIGRFYFIAPGSTATINAPSSGAVGTTLDKEALFWRSIDGSEDAEAYRAYLAQYPNGTFAGLASLRIKRLTQKAQPANESISEGPTQSSEKTPKQQGRAQPGDLYESLDGIWVARSQGWSARLEIADERFALRLICERRDPPRIQWARGRLGPQGKIPETYLSGGAFQLVEGYLNALKLIPGGKCDRAVFKFTRESRGGASG